jgi:hypothetical protein
VIRDSLAAGPSQATLTTLAFKLTRLSYRHHFMQYAMIALILLGGVALSAIGVMSAVQTILAAEPSGDARHEAVASSNNMIAFD